MNKPAERKTTMSDLQSNLASTGFDYVVGVTQDSINANLEQFLYNGQQEVIICFIYDENNNLVPADYATFVASADNTDPFSVPDGTSHRDARVQNLADAEFAFAVKATLGLPPGVAPADLPPIVQLKPGQSYVTYTMMFSEFVATAINYPHVTWFNESQQPGTPWTFTGPVDLNFQDKSFTDLPPDVQQRIKDIGDPNMFSVQQLYYDLNNSGLVQNFTFNQIPSNSPLNAFMTSDFVDTYFKGLPKGAEALGYAAQQTSATPSSIAVTDVNFFAPDPVGPGGAPLTLNYLCAANNNNLPDTTHAGFGWNWIEPSEASQYDGAAALNRNTLASYLNNVSQPDGNTLFSYAQRNCYEPSVTVSYTGGIEIKVDYSWNLAPGQTPTVNIPTSGGTILSYSYDSGDVSDQAGLNGDAGKMDLRSTFNMSVSVQGNEITIVRHLVIYTYVRYLATDAPGANVVDIQYTDVYTVGVNDQGQIMAASKSSIKQDTSHHPGADGFLNFWADVQSLADSVTQWAQSIAYTSLNDIPVSFVQNFIFPGGSTFSFSDAGFSANQDLVSHITYASVS
jgi:hypothetical protein